MLEQVLYAAAGLVLLTYAADHLVLGASRIAGLIRLSPVVVGIVVIGLGTSAPEFLVSGVAAARGDTAIALGNIVGSNILNITLILGVAALVARVSVDAAVVRREVPLAVGSTVLFGLLSWAGLTPVAGVFLALVMATALGLLLRWAHQGRNQPLAEEVVDFEDLPSSDTTQPTGGQADGRQPSSRRVWLEPLRAVVGLVGVLAGAQLLVANAAAIASDLGVPQIVIGFTLVALGTSLPELVTTIQAQRRRETNLVVGNLFGSNLFNSLAGGAVIAFAAPADTAPSTGAALTLTMIMTSALGWALLRRGLRLTRADGAVLLIAYALSMPLLLSA